MRYAICVVLLLFIALFGDEKQTPRPAPINKKKLDNKCQVTNCFKMLNFHHVRNLVCIASYAKYSSAHSLDVLEAASISEKKGYLLFIRCISR